MTDHLTTSDDNFHGAFPDYHDDHRTVGSHRAWSFRSTMWCYPSDPCDACKVAQSEALDEMVRVSEELGLYDDEGHAPGELPPCPHCGSTADNCECRFWCDCDGPCPPRPTDDPLPARLERFHDRLDELVEWLDIIDRLSVKLSHPELAGTEMQDDIRSVCADAAAAAARLRELEAEVEVLTGDCARLADASQGLMMLKEDALARIRELEAEGDVSLERLTTEGTRHPFIIGRAMDHYSDDVVVARRCLQRLCDLVTTVTAERDRLTALGNALTDEVKESLDYLPQGPRNRLQVYLDAWENR